MNKRIEYPGMILRAALLAVLLASFFGAPATAIPAVRAQAEGTDPHTPVQSPPLRQDGDYQELLDALSQQVEGLTVLGPDGRTRITPTNSIPWQYIARILFVYPNTTTKICSGYFIGPYTIITAGHCVYDPARGGWITDAFITPGLDGTTEPFGTARAILSYSTDGWVNNGDKRYDYGAVQLPNDATIGYQTGWMPYGYFSDSYLNAYLSGGVNLAGYALDKGDSDCALGAASCLWWQSGALASIYTPPSPPQDYGLLNYVMDTDPNGAQAGSPLFVVDGGQFRAIGLHVFEQGDLSSPTGCDINNANCGLRITGEVATNFTTWSGQGPVTNCYPLTLAHTGEGSDPSASPIKSAGCRPGEYLPGTLINLTASPAENWRVASWLGSNNDSSTALTNQVTMPASAHTVTVNYEMICHAFSATVSPPAGGSLYFDPLPNCPGGYGQGTTVRVIALAAPGYAIKDWSGSATGSANPLAINIDGPKSITANFVPALSGGTYDNTHPLFAYTPTPVKNYADAPVGFGPNWTTYPSAYNYNKTLHMSKAIGDSVTIPIYGIGFKLTYVQASNRGLIDVYVDDVRVGSINAYSTSTVWQKVWTSPTLTPGVHILRFVHISGAFIDIDALTVTPVPDVIPPGNITDLAAATGDSGGSVNLSWTAPGDDITAGTATSYLVRYSTAPITSESAWNAATPVTNGVPAPLPGGSLQTMTVTGLTPGATFYFSVRARDEVGNLGGLSNSPDADAQIVIPLGMGTHDNNNTNISYNGAWTYYPSVATAYNRTLHLSTAVGNSASFYVQGTTFTLVYTAAANRGKMDIYIDNNPKITLNMYSATTIWQRKWTSPTLSNGIHTVRLVHASGTYVDLDAIIVPDGIPPAAIINLSGVSGAAAGSVTLTWDAVGDDGINGTATSYLVRYSNMPISSETLWNAATPVTAGVPTPGPFGTGETMTVTGLFPGNTYYFSVRAVDDVGNLGGLSNSPGIQATPTVPLPVGMHDDPNPNIVYMGGPWTFWPSTTGPYNRTLHTVTASTAAAAAQNQVVFSFTGTKITLYYTQSTNRGRADIYIDGIKVATLNMYGATVVWQKQWVSNAYPLGTHTVRIVQVFVSTSTPMIDFDAVQVHP